MGFNDNKERRKRSRISVDKAYFDNPEFEEYLNWIIHDWSRISTTLAYTLVPLFFILDYFTMPAELLSRFAVYRGVATIIAVIQFIILKRTSPGRLSYLHGYMVSLNLGGVIALMTVDLGGFSSGYYAGLNLVIIGVNLLLPWKAYHSAINGFMTVIMYVALNLVFGNDYKSTDMISNLFFLNGTVIIAVSINYVRHKLTKQEFYLRTELQKVTAALWGEMEIAKKIQTSLLPKTEVIGGYELCAVMEPAAEIGGDYYDVVETEAGENWLMIGDVSGHGVESGLIMMMTQTSIYTLINNTPGFRPSILIQYVNSVIRKNISKLGSNRYMTLYAMRLDKSSITLSGKHQDLVIYRSNSGNVEIIPVQGTWIGLADDIIDYLKDIKIAIGIGDIILLFTDGVTEAMNADGVMFGQLRLVVLFEKYAKYPPREIISRILESVKSFQEKQEDDITLMVLKRIE